MHNRLAGAAQIRYVLPIAAFALTIIGYFNQSVFDPLQVKPIKLLIYIAFVLNALAFFP